MPLEQYGLDGVFLALDDYDFSGSNPSGATLIAEASGVVDDRARAVARELAHSSSG